MYLVDTNEQELRDESSSTEETKNVAAYASGQFIEPSTDKTSLTRPVS